MIDGAAAFFASSASLPAVNEALVVERGEARSYDDEKRRVTWSRLISATSSSTCLVEGDADGDADGSRAPFGPGPAAAPAGRLRDVVSPAPVYVDVSPLRRPEAALSLDVIHWRTMAEKRTVGSAGLGG